MQIAFTDSFVNGHQKLFNFNQSHIRDSLINKDEVQKIGVDGKEILLFKKKSSDFQVIFLLVNSN